MKKFISLMCIVLTFATLFCACNGDEPVETQPVTESVTTTEPETTKAPAPKEEIKPYIDAEKTVRTSATELKTMRIKAFTQTEVLDGKNVDVTYQHAQGGCIMGNYLITCMHTPAKKNVHPQMVCIVKSDLKTGEIVKKSKGMPLGHGNDATYNPDDNILVIADCGGNGHNILFIMDPDTLELKETKKVQGSGTTICAIDYDTVNKRYVAVGAQNDYVHIYNRNFVLLKEHKGYGMTKGDPYKGEFSEQGIKTDGKYLYILEWHGGSIWAEKNATIEREVRANILVTDLSTGKHVATIDTGIKRELEYMVYHNGKIYIACNNISWTGMEFYRVDVSYATT